jgi:hypothetical protein
MVGALCQGCTDANEVLVGKDDSKGYRCEAYPSGNKNNSSHEQTFETLGFSFSFPIGRNRDLQRTQFTIK